ncbi:hypothetical protein FEE95_06810 [Maribacter algarum]|uniref:Thiopeptide-type bacteriocin biosynthesis domain-containing protein n=1 Tax=Maribacter algarum (ex Zhang et al. 2020) TaxID=2578118 RepID=A0A5S3PVU0_9FLAO|nr:thiopeptide-type bacteriocin biosynthesis protein [Maribacter algarum]TMM59136.1 hypothetical protein FEE95_06810 [Maribacter algarum]
MQQRNFIFGSEWVYYKLYTGSKTSDSILTDVIKPISEELLACGAIDKWFFIRYADPKHHLRIRFHCPDTNRILEVIKSLKEPLNNLFNKDLIWKIQTDTYVRELERYGAKTMELSETIFYYDSKCCIDFIALIEGDVGEELRWLFGLRAIDFFLSAFQFTTKQKLDLLEKLKTGFGEEFGMGRPLKKQLDDKFRNERDKIEHFMSFSKVSEPDYGVLLNLLEEKNKSVGIISKEILGSIEQGSSLTLDSLISSYIHMLMNRLFKSKNRLNEMVCYDFLYRYYRSFLARNKKLPNKTALKIN